MSLNSQIRNIPLSANCDLSKYNADIYDYQNFVECNSLFLNKRLTPWLKRSLSNNELSNGFTYQVNENNFDIYKNGEYKFSVSRSYYKDEIVEEKSGVEAENPMSDTDSYHLIVTGKYEDTYPLLAGKYRTTQYGSCNNLSAFTFKYASSNEILVIVKDHKVYIYNKSNQLKSEIELPETISCNDNTVSFKWCDEEISETVSIYSYSWTITIPAHTLLITLWDNKSDSTAYYASSACGSYALSIDSTGSATLLEESDIISGSFTEYTDDTNILSRYSGLANEANFIIYTLNDKICVFNNYSITTLSATTYYVNIWENLQNSTTATTFSYEDSIKSYLNISTEHLSTGAVKITLEWDSYSDTGTYIGRCLTNVQNYSKKFGIFAINYVGGEAANIAHDYKKLVDFSQFTPDSIYYEDNAIYYDKDDEIHKITIETTDTPIYSMLGEYYLIFNTITYKNAYIIPYEKQVCSCDDWNNRVFWCSGIAGAFENCASRYGNNWQTLSSLIVPSAQYASLITEIAIGDNHTTYYDSDPENMVATFLDSSYTCPSDMQYEVFFPDYVGGTTSYSQYKQGYISKPSYTDSGMNSNPFTIEHDEGKVWSDSDEYQDNPALLSTTFLSFGSNYYADVNDAVYSLLTYTLHSQLPALIFLMTESVESYDSDFLIFVINGQQYTYYPVTHKIYDSNDSWVANTQLFYYIGYNTKAAFFYNVFDKGIYIFQGDNSMQKIAVIEKYSVVTSSNFFSVNSLTIPSMSLIIINLTDKIGILYDEQFCIIDIGETIESMSIDNENGTFTINDKMYSLTGAYYDDWEQMPIELETEFFGEKDSESNVINDTVYLTLDNLAQTKKGSLKVSFKVLQNNNVISFNSQTVNLSETDFNKKNIAQIKIQPKIQECRGFKLLLESDFEIAELKIGTSSGAMNQTTKRI